MKIIILSKSVMMLLTVIIVCTGCGGTGSRTSLAGQIVSNSWEGEDVLGEKDVWKTLRPPVIITKADSGDVIALFIGEFAPKIVSEEVYIDYADDKAVLVYGIPIELRIKVNDIIASPTGSILTTSPVIINKYETRSFLASVRNLPPGTHTITAEWRSAEKDVKVGNRTLTVWETVRVSASP